MDQHVSIQSQTENQSENQSQHEQVQQDRYFYYNGQAYPKHQKPTRTPHPKFTLKNWIKSEGVSWEKRKPGQRRFELVNEVNQEVSYKFKKTSLDQWILEDGENPSISFGFPGIPKDRNGYEVEAQEQEQKQQTSKPWNISKFKTLKDWAFSEGPTFIPGNQKMFNVQQCPPDIQVQKEYFDEYVSEYAEYPIDPMQLFPTQQVPHWSQVKKHFIQPTQYTSVYPEYPQQYPKMYSQVYAQRYPYQNAYQMYYK